MSQKTIEEFFEYFQTIFILSGVAIRPASGPANRVKSVMWMCFIALVLASSIIVLVYYQKRLLSDTGALSTTIDGF